MKCPKCKSLMKRKQIKYNFNDLKLGRFEADVCRKCGEKIFTEKALTEIDKKAEKLGVWKPKMKPPEMLYI